ncbi:alpha-2A adrenergic receptor-like [Limulus polyphemus]|uniref:Alpha-2A adrenergic receptor-like n=1 Tax=Limulus polyphemus TaxID=6850 RepID=A0ABM1TDG9_LIMPO|nr:alpha-2A adrenergic receptor-like [Limulus polyphemus]XP_022253930.1 alpha-2A adrenergic receptor-like [Limulus polyphemus]XP_022253935.1 alpha-2A adrenergic receptor-like [Limulus polyphemus]XP_022253941.1 alpha-2A adrenergic receptor-like [Limulus polyphemus]
MITSHILNNVTIVSVLETAMEWNDTNTTVNESSSLMGQTTEYQTNHVEWEKPWGGAPYPSGYSQTQIILIAFFVSFLMVLIVVGNMLVCIAIATEKSLKTVQNWFIASLAVSDFLVGLVIMPFSLANELMGYWIFGTIWCEIHAALDVLLCTASINNLCLISLDRYWSVTHAVEYLKKRTPTRAIAMICFVWFLSGLISLPPLVGWKKPDRPTDYPECKVSEEIGYVLYSALGSFYIPAAVMVFVYIRIFFAARSRARRHVKKRAQPEVTNDPGRDKSTTTTTTTCTSFSNPSPPDKRKDLYGNMFFEKLKTNGNGEAHNKHFKLTPTRPQIILENSAEEREDSDKEHEMKQEEGRKPTVHFPLQSISGSSGSRDDEQKSIYSIHSISKSNAHPGPYSLLLKTPRVLKTTFGSTLSLENYSKEGNANELYETRHIYGRGKSNLGKCTFNEPTRSYASSAVERQKRKIAKARERRATVILGLIMAAFILAWLPFFVLYVLSAICKHCKISDTGFDIAFWLGYFNSAINPIIYTIFNRDFRKAFRKILLK